MKHQGITEESQTTAALYALGALSQHEAQSFENHLSEGCAVCTDELKEFNGVATTIGLASAEATPPPYLRDLLMSRIEKEAQTSPSIVRFPEQVKPASHTAGSAALFFRTILHTLGRGGDRCARGNSFISGLAG